MFEVYNKCPELAPKYIDEIRLITSSKLCASYEPIYVPIIIYCLRAFVVVYMLMNNVCVQIFNFIRASMCKL